MDQETGDTRGNDDSSQGHDGEKSGFNFEGKDRPMGILGVPRKDEAPKDNGAKKHDGFQIPDWKSTVQPKGQAGMTCQRRGQRGDCGQFQDPGLGKIVIG